MLYAEDTEGSPGKAGVEMQVGCEGGNVALKRGARHRAAGFE
jgi:hypothetical protein